MGHRYDHGVETLIVIQSHFLLSFFHPFTVQKEISGTIMHSCIYTIGTPFRYPKVKILSVIIIKRYEQFRWINRCKKKLTMYELWGIHAQRKPRRVIVCFEYKYCFPTYAFQLIHRIFNDIACSFPANTVHLHA